MVLCMMCTVASPLASITVSAAAPVNYSTIYADSSVYVSLPYAGDTQYFKFVPTATGTYRFYSSDYSGDPKATLSDSEGNAIITNDDGAVDRNFDFTYECIANTTYYIRAFMWSDYTGSYTLNVQTIEVDCTHDYQLDSSTPPTCTAAGEETYVCTICYHSYTANTERLGHDFTDGVCSRCGAEPSVADIWDGSVDTSWYDSYNEEFFIENAAQLAGLAELVNNGNSFYQKTIFLENDIDLAGLEWTPIGTESYPFEGTFEGQNHVIYNLTINNSFRHSGLFGYTRYAAIGYLGLKNVNITSTYSGGPAMAGALAGAQESTSVYYCFMEGSVTTQNNDQLPTGGLIGLFMSGNVFDCYAISDIFSNSSYSSQAGGLIGTTGWYHNETVYVENCYVISNIVTSGSSTYAYAGGIVGVNCATSINILNCFVVDSNISSNGYVSTILGYNVSGNVVSISSCHHANSTVGSYYNGTQTTADNFRSQDWIVSNLYWDFNDVWTFSDESEYPVLQGFGDYVAHAHVFEETARVESTCAEAGYIEYTCSECGYSYEEELDMPEHSFEETARVDSTCTEEGSIEYTCSACGESYEEELEKLDHDFENGACTLCGKTLGGNVLLIEDILPWGSYANTVTLERLVSEGKIAGYEKHSSFDLADGIIDLNDYALVILAADQNQSFYNNIPIQALADYADNGGAIFLAADTTGHASGSYYVFPFGITSTRSAYEYNNIVDYTHPMVTGIYSDNRVLTDSDMYGRSMSHNYFTNYPENSNVILQDGSGRATLLEFEYGQGLVVVSGLTFECAYDYSWNFFYGYDDIIVHLYNNNGVNEGHTHNFVETSRTEATCTVDGRINYSCSSCAATKVGVIPAFGHSIETVIETEVSCTTDGLIVDRCTNYGCSYEKQTVIHGSHNYTITARLEASCETQGYIEYTCSNCNDKRYEYFEGMHDYVESERIDPDIEIEGSVTYTCTVCEDSYSIVIPALVPVLKNSSVLLIQDSRPWAEDTNTALLEALKERGVVSSYNIISSTALANFDLSQYGVVFIANDQSSATYNRLAENAEKLEAYVMAGGNLIYGACDAGWGGGYISHALPGGVTTSNYYSVHNYIVNGLHPIVTGVNTDNRSLREELLKGNYCSHTYFDIASLPEGSDIILRDANGNPTLVEYKIGNGTVIASGLTWEYFYVRNHYDMTTNYSKYAYDDLVTYMVYMSDTCEHEYEMVEFVEATCEENGYTRYVCSLCEREYMGDLVAATGHNAGEWTTEIAATCLPGRQYIACTSCNEVLETAEIAPAWDHEPGDWIVDTPATCAPGSQHKICIYCETTVETAEIEPVSDHAPSEWIVDTAPTSTSTGHRHTECLYCQTVIETDVMPILAKLVIQNVLAEAGRTVRVTIDVQNNPGIIGALLTLSYDPSLILIDAQAGSAWNSLNFTTPQGFTNPCNFVWDGVNGADFSDGEIIVLTFVVPEGVDIGTVFEISASYTYGNMINADLETVDVEIENGSITIIDPIGDVNDDGIVDVADVIVLRRYLAGGYDVVIDEVAADMDADGYITVADVVLLRRFLVNPTV